MGTFRVGIKVEIKVGIKIIQYVRIRKLYKLITLQFKRSQIYEKFFWQGFLFDLIRKMTLNYEVTRKTVKL